MNGPKITRFFGILCQVLVPVELTSIAIDCGVRCDTVGDRCNPFILTASNRLFMLSNSRFVRITKTTAFSAFQRLDLCSKASAKALNKRITAKKVDLPRIL